MSDWWDPACLAAVCDESRFRAFKMRDCSRALTASRTLRRGYVTDPLRSALLAAPARLNSCSLLQNTPDSTSPGWSFHSTDTENMELQLKEEDI